MRSDLTCSCYNAPSQRDHPQALSPYQFPGAWQKAAFPEQSSQTRSSLRTHCRCAFPRSLSRSFRFRRLPPADTGEPPAADTRNDPEVLRPLSSACLPFLRHAAPSVIFPAASREILCPPRAHQISASFLHHNRRLQSRWGTSRMPLRFRQRAVRSASSGCNRRGCLNSRFFPHAPRPLKSPDTDVRCSTAAEC